MNEAPSFFLYGEPPRAAEAGFLHLEPLDVRSRPSGWSIRLHRHDDLNHVFLMTGGAGALMQGAQALPFSAPCLLLIPSGVAHGFTFQRESTGHVLTLSTEFLQQRSACAEVLDTLFAAPLVLGSGAETAKLQGDFVDLSRELAWQAPGHHLAVEGLICRVLVCALRLERQARATLQTPPVRDQALLARLRELVEQSYRENRSLDDYARALGISLSRLHQICRASGATPLGLIHARVLLEATRGLLYSDMSVTELALDLGFTDLAYFSRFFKRHIGCAPSQFRRAPDQAAHQVAGPAVVR
jgi:AraC family transcriptional regulator, transcriptional activator of pobA